MRILVHIHTLNDEASIGHTLEAVQNQSYGVAEILLVDNGSTDGTLARSFLEAVTVMREPINVGTSGAVRKGLRYAFDHGYEWLWVLDGDSLPRPDALAKLVSLYESLGEAERAKVGVLSSSQALAGSVEMVQGRVLTPGGPRRPTANDIGDYHECDCAIWSGSLLRVEAVMRVGFPRGGEKGYWDDLALDYGDMEFTYRMRRAGYKVLIDHSSLIDHPLGATREKRILGWRVIGRNYSATRRYLFFRNLTFFWLYLYSEKNWPVLIIWFVQRLTVTILGILVLEGDRLAKISACVRGAWDGLLGRLDRSFAEVTGAHPVGRTGRSELP